MYFHFQPGSVSQHQTWYSRSPNNTFTSWWSWVLHAQPAVQRSENNCSKKYLIHI